MKASALFIGALAALANATLQLTDSNYNIVAGQAYTITWTGASGDVTILLKNGNSGDLKTVQTITTSGTGGSFTWTPPSSLPSDTYALEITDASGSTNYSPQFTFAGNGTPSATSSTASSTSASSSTSSSASTTTAHTITTTAANSTTTSTTSTRTPISNSTTLTTSASTTASGTSTGSSSSSSASASSTRVPNTNDGHRVASSLALILSAVAAFAAFN